MESNNNNNVIMVTIDWHRIVCIAYFITFGYISLMKKVNQ